MENKILSNELTSAIHAVGDMIKSDPRHSAVQKASDDYANSAELSKLLEEYRALFPLNMKKKSLTIKQSNLFRTE